MLGGTAMRSIRKTGFLAALPRALTDPVVLGLVGLSVIAFLGLLVHDALLLGRTAYHPEDAPLAAPGAAWRSLLALALSVGIALAVRRAQDAPAALDRAETVIAGLASVGVLALGALLLADPILFGRLAWEDGPTETLSAVATGLGAIVFAWVAVSAARRRAVTLAAGAGVLALGLVALTGEEVSWGQRIFGVETPPDLASINDQGEMNLHNVVTEESELLYYVGGFALLIGLPFVADARGRSGPLGPLLPARAVALTAAPMAALDYDLWGVLPVQMTTWLTLAALMVWGGRRANAAWLLAACVLAVQIVVLWQGDTMVRRWDVKEHKELVLALGFLAYAASAARAERRARRGSQAASAA